MTGELLAPKPAGRLYTFTDFDDPVTGKSQELLGHVHTGDGFTSEADTDRQRYRLTRPKGMRKRTREVFELIEEDMTVSVEVIAKRLGISEKTAQRQLTKIGELQGILN